MEKLINKIRSYRPPKYICLLYFFVPIFLSVIMKLNKENDIWFLLNHGEYVLNHGFPTIEPFSMHEGFSFVMQQWLSAVIFYLSYHLFGQYGLLTVVVGINALILFFLYKLCMLLSDGKYTLSTIIACITDIFLMIFITPRPQIFTYLVLIMVLYIMELFYKNKNSKAIYFLPIISFFHINLHASMWFMIYLFMLPYVVCLFVNKIKNKTDNRIFKLLIVILIMLLVGFINPYGIDNILYIFNSYGNKYINNSIIEMLPPAVNANDGIGAYSKLAFILMGIVLSMYIYYKDGKLVLRHMLLLLGVIVLTLCNIRSLSLFIIGSFPFLSSYLKRMVNDNEKEYNLSKAFKLNYCMIIFLFFFFLIFASIHFQGRFTYNNLEEGIDYLLKNNKKEDIILYTNYYNGSYAEYRGLKPYIDTRAEVFLKANNKCEDIFKEYYLLDHNLLDYHNFIDKYNFTHLIVDNTESLYKNIIKDNRYKVIYKGKDYKIFERVK